MAATASLMTRPSTSLPLPKDDRITSIGTTAMSCAISTPTVIRPVAVRNSPSSSSICIATAVDEIATMKPSAITASIFQPKTRPSSAATARLATIWPAVTIDAIPATVAKTRTESSIPIRKSSMITPSSASAVIEPVLETRPNPVGPRTTPARM